MKMVGKSVWPKVLFAIATIFAVIMGFLVLVATRPLPEIQPEIVSQNSSQTEVVDLAWPVAGNASIGTLVDGLKSTNGDVSQKPTASMAKTITVLVVLGKYPLAPNESGPTITMTDNDVALYNQTVANDGTNLRITSGQQLTERDMINGIMLVSANNLADSLAIWAYGSMDNYRAAANVWLAKNNLRGTTIGKDASGLDPGTTSSVGDLFQIGVLAMKNLTFKEVVAQKTAEFPGAGVITNTDRLIGTDGFVGIKTGYTPEAGACYLFANTDDNATFVGVVTMQATTQSRFDVTKTLVNSAKDNFITENIAKTGQVFAQYNAPWGSSANAVASGDLSASHWKDQAIQPEISTDLISQNTKSGSIVGAAKYGDQTTDLVLDQEISSPSLWWRVTHLGQLVWKF